MRRFVQKALEKLDRLGGNQIRSLVLDLATENELLWMVLESMSDGVVVTDREDRVLVVNKSAQRMIPFNTEEPAEKPLWETIQDREIAAFFEENLRTLDRVKDREFTLGNGYVRTLAVSLMPLVRKGEITGNVVHIEDVTDKRSKEARLRRAESLAALTTLTAGVAHEIKNPLGSIGIHLELIRKEMNGRETIATSRVGEILSVIREEVERLNRIVVDFLFAVRPMNAELEYGDLNKVVQELLEFLKFELDAEDIVVQAELDPRLPQIRLDQKYMKQALLNVIKNAIAAMPEGGLLGVSTYQKGGELFLRIRDTGVGIPEENMGKIFEPYFTTREFGSGLGLTVVYKIVKEHLGEIAIDSRPGEGTTVTLSFPIPQKERRLIDFQEARR